MAGRMLRALRRDGWRGLADRLRLRAAFRTPGPWTLALEGGRFSFRHRGELYAYVETFVRHVYDALPGFTPAEGWTVVDVGANVGCFSAYALCRRHRGRLLAAEPNPEACARLRALTSDWAARRPGLAIRVRQAAAGAAPGRASFVVPAGASVRGALADLGAPAAGGEQERFEVEVLTLDDWLGAEGVIAVDLLKIDVEGAEAEVLAGAGQTLRTTARVVLEWHGPERLEAVRQVLAAVGLRQVHSAADPDDPRVGTAYFRR